MYADLNGQVLLSGTVIFPRSGAWHADLVVDGDAPPTGALTLTVGGTKLACAAYRAGGYAGTSYARVVGGKGGLAKPLASRQYVAAPARVVVNQILSEAGEALSSTADAGLLGTTLDVWTRSAAVAGRALADVCDAIGASWRVLTDGTVWVGAETWPDAGLIPADYVRTDLGPAEGWVEIAAEVKLLTPGTTFLGRRVSLVRHRVEPGQIRSEAWFEGTG